MYTNKIMSGKKIMFMVRVASISYMHFVTLVWTVHGMGIIYQA